ncbi:MAG: hypothetical protein ACOY4Q_09365 [Bacillota bacterium]
MSNPKSKFHLVLSVLVMAVFLFTGTAWAGETAKDDKIKLEIHHLLLTSKDNTLQVKEVMRFQNTGSDIYTGSKNAAGQAEVLKVSLPAGYRDLQVIGVPQNTVVTTAEGITTTTPVAPGELEITLLYSFPFNGGQVELGKTVNYPTDILYVLSPKGDLRLDGKKTIVDYDYQTMEGKQYRIFFLEKAAKNQKFSLTAEPDLVGQGYTPGKSNFHSNSHLSRWYNSPLAGTDPHMWVAIIVILVFAGITVTGYYLRKKQKERKRIEEEEKLARLLDDLVIKQKRLMTKIAALDERHEKGEVTPDEYEELREQYKSRLVKIKLKIKQLEEIEEVESF